jgi:hypothetical protein
VTTPPTLIPLTTRSGSCRPVPWLNQPRYQGKAEPSRSNRTCALARFGSSASPGQNGTTSVPVESEASSLLVILHYLLKNNTRFYVGLWGRLGWASSTFCRPAISFGGAHPW